MFMVAHLENVLDFFPDRVVTKFSSCFTQFCLPDGSKHYRVDSVHLEGMQTHVNVCSPNEHFSDVVHNKNACLNRGERTVIIVCR